MDGGEETQKVSGLESFLTKPDNSLMMDKLFNDIETIIYHKIGLGVSINNKDIYELGRHIGKAQLLINTGTDIMIHSKDEKAVKQIGKEIFQIINDISEIYVILAENSDLNSFDYKLSLFKQDINYLKDLILKFVNVWFVFLFYGFGYRVVNNGGWIYGTRYYGFIW